ncbi:MAG: hypothetical protein K2O24_00010 [Muribaculaceae bacterium]|nr:hypothetical protein [Muribaculaceae bacterium]
MNQRTALTFAGIAATLCPAAAQVFVSTDTYTWHGDTISQGEFFATAPSETSIVSTYSATPGYFMPIDKEWHLKNDISAYPRLKTPNRLHTAIYNMGLDEMVNAVEPDTTLRTGKEWAGVWTRDVSYSILLSMAYMQPEAARISLMKKVDPLGRIIQDTGSGGAWPVSTDRMIWAVAAWEVYKVTGDMEWLRYVYPIVKRSLEDDLKTAYDPVTGLVKGETSFIDWREQSHPKWMQTADIYSTQTLSTSVVHARAWQVLADMAETLGHKKEAREARAQAEALAAAINEQLWLDDKGYYAMYLYGRDNLISNPRADNLGEALAIMWDVAPEERAAILSQSMPVTPFGPPIFYPQISDMPPYHNNALWPWVASWWGLASAKTGNEDGVMQAIGSVFRPAALFATNKENLNLDNGDIATELNSSNMLWCLSGNIALTHKILFGLDFRKDGLAFHPFVPKAMKATRSLEGFRYRDAVLNITVEGYGDKIKEFTVNGKRQEPFIPAKKAKGTMDVRIVMDDQDIEPMRVNNVANAKAPLTPITWLEETQLVWNPIEYINHYVVIRDGERIAETRSTTFDASTPGEYQVIGVADSGIESFASEPRSTRKAMSFQVPGEKTAMVSEEISYPASEKPAGYRGRGFVETDHANPTVTIPVVVPEEGRYAITVRYANGNGPVNTENKCAIRTLLVDGHKEGVVVLPHRGRANWNDWGTSNSVIATLPAGRHEITLTLLPENENMNIHTNHALIDCVTLTRLK